MNMKQFIKKAAALAMGGLFVFGCACAKGNVSSTEGNSASTSATDTASSSERYELSATAESITLAEKETADLPVVFTKNGEAADKGLLTFYCSDHSKAEVDEQGKVTGRKEGRCFIRVSYGEESVQITVRVTKEIVWEIRTDREQYALAKGVEGGKELQATAGLFVDGAEQRDAKIEFSVADDSIAEVGETGLIKAKNPGKTVLTARSGKAEKEIPITVYDTATAAQVNSFDEAYVNTFGRTYSDGGLKIDHVASGTEVAFFGTKLTASIDTSGEVYARIFIDGDTEGKFTFLRSDSFTVLADGLKNGCHTLRILKSCELTDGQFKIKSFSAKQFLKMPEKSEFKIEFIGDSITTGYGALGTNAESRQTDNSDACSSFAYYTAQKLNADFSMVALQGICVNVHMWQPQYKMSELYRYVSPFNQKEYDFADRADVVVLGLGTNEATYLGQKDAAYAEKFAEDYCEFLRYIRSKRKDAKIICVYGMMGRNQKIHDGIQKAIQSTGDKNIVYLSDFADNRGGAGSHPSKDAQERAGKMLADYLSLHGAQNK